jgi:DNA-binding SARP family transcriptional activator
MARLHLRLLGGFEVRLESGPPVTLPTRKTQALLAYLALAAGSTYPRDKLTALLWGSTPDRRARHSLRQALSALRKVLAAAAAAPEILVEGEHVALDRAAVAVDALDFERQVKVGTLESLEAALDLYRGELLEGLPVGEPAFEEWLIAERERLRELALQALARLVGLHDKRGVTDAAIQAAQKLLSLDPLQEAAHRALMRLYARDGRRGAALRQYQACLDVLQRELGTEPEPETRELYHDLLRQRRTATPAERPEMVREAAPAPIPPQPGLPGGAGIVGRADELARLGRALDGAREDRGVVAALVGEAGVGKSRLVEEVVALAEARGLRVATGRAYELEGALPLGPWIDAIPLDRTLADLGGTQPRSPGADPLRLFEAVAQLLGHLAASGPLLLVLEDLQWADELSLNLLSFISRRVGGWAVMVLVTAREEEATPGLARLLRGLDEQGQLTLRLGRLSRAQTTLLVRALAGSARRPRAQARLDAQVWALSEGNPFMVVETVRAAAERGRTRPSERLPLPDRIRRVVLGRLERLSEGAQRLVAAAAVIGREFEFDLLRRVAGLAERQTAEGVEELVRRGLLRASGELLEFTHDSIRQVAHERLLEPMRRGLHHATAEALEAAHADRLEAVRDRLAHHYAQGQDAPRAVKYLVLSAEAASARYAVTGAVRSLEQALEHARRLPAAERDRPLVDVSLRLATALSNLGKFAEILKLLQPLRPMVERLADPAVAGVYHFRLALSQSLLGDHAGARRAARQALADATAAGDAATTAKAHYVLAVEGFTTGGAADGAEHARRAVRLLEPLDDRRWLSLAHWILGLNHLLLGELEDALAAEDTAAVFGRALQDRSLESFATGATAWIRLVAGDWARAREAAQESLDRAPDAAARATAQGLLAFASLAGGVAGVTAARVVRALEQAIEHLAPFGIRQCLLLHFLAETHLLDRDVDRAKTVAARCLALGEEIGFAWAGDSARRLLERVAPGRSLTSP